MDKNRKTNFNLFPNCNNGENFFNGDPKNAEFEDWACENFNLLEYVGEDSSPMEDVDKRLNVENTDDDLREKDILYQYQQYETLIFDQEDNKPRPSSHDSGDYEVKSYKTPNSRDFADLTQISDYQRESPLLPIPTFSNNMCSTSSAAMQPSTSKMFLSEFPIKSESMEFDSDLPYIVTETGPQMIAKEVVQHDIPDVTRHAAQHSVSTQHDAPDDRSECSIEKPESTHGRKKLRKRVNAMPLSATSSFVSESSPEVETVKIPKRNNGQKKPRKYRVKSEQEKQNPSYRVKRAKNNDAVRRSRDKAKKEQEFKEERLQQLEVDNVRMKKTIEQLESRNEFLEKEILRMRQNCNCKAAIPRVRGRLI